MKKSKALLVTLCAVLLIVASVMGTMAYLTSTDSVTNTFTVGNVQITLDEAKTNINGNPMKGEDTVKDVKDADRTPDGNQYKLLPGHTYTKDPTVTVKAQSEPCYVKMTVTLSKAAELDAIFAPDGADLMQIFEGYESSTWIAKGNTKEEDTNTRTYTFYYKDKVDASDNDVVLDALFDSIKVPGNLTGDQLATLAPKDSDDTGFTITVNAYAVQADGFDSADAAFTTVTDFN